MKGIATTNVVQAVMPMRMGVHVNKLARLLAIFHQPVEEEIRFNLQDKPWFVVAEDTTVNKLSVGSMPLVQGMFINWWDLS